MSRKLLAVIVAVTVLVVGIAVAENATDDMNEFGEWCDDNNGTLMNSNSFYRGGLYCDFPNGTSVYSGDFDGKNHGVER